MNLKKTSCFTNRIDYLGHIIKLRCLAASTYTNDAIRCLQTFSNIMELRRFLGLCNVFRLFIADSARMAAALKRKWHKYQPHVYIKLSGRSLKLYKR